MSNNNTIVKDLVENFSKIKKKGWVKNIRNGSTGVGMTLEHLLNITENNFEIPDYNGIEIKTKRNYSESYTTLFNCTPEGTHYKETERLKNKYGYPDSILKSYKVINNSIFANQLTKIGTKHYFKLNIDRENQKVILYVFNIFGELLENNVYWSFETLKDKLYRKVKMIAFVDALRKFVNYEEYFKYYKMTIYTIKDFDTFLDLIEAGIIRVTFKIGVFRSGERKGQIHDHGTGFDIKECDLLKLYKIHT